MMSMAWMDQRKEGGSPLKTNESTSAYGRGKIEKEREKWCKPVYQNVLQFCWWETSYALVLSEERWRKKWTCKQGIEKEHTSFGLLLT